MSEQVDWIAANQLYLAEALAGLRDFIKSKNPRSLDPKPWTLPQAPAVETLCNSFGLSSFERNLLLLCTGAEMDCAFADVTPTFGFGLATFPDAHWSAISPAAPLRRWRLIDLAPDLSTLVNSRLKIQERVLHYLAGVKCLDDGVQALVKPVSTPAHVPPSQRELAARIASLWRLDDAMQSPVVVLCGTNPENGRALAGFTCASLGLALHVMSASDLPANAPDLDTLLRLWERESILSSTALLVECGDGDSAATLSLVKKFMQNLNAPLVISTPSAIYCPGRATAVFDAGPPGEREQAELWNAALGPSFPQLNGTAESLAAQFTLTATAIAAVCDQALAANPENEEDLNVGLWDSCRTQARPRLQSLAQRMESANEWDDLVLRSSQKQTLRQIAIHVRQRSIVYNTWGFAAKGARGLGITALFAGPSGTGKTMAAEVLANELRLDVYRIDLSQVISKYIGETEKNLARVFDAAEEGAAVLLFDEADALFGKRSEVKDSHDRYANIEVSYLLQRMEAYRGLAILTTNRKSSLDQAFLRRIRFVVDFPVPDLAERTDIWRRVFPKATPVEDLRMDRLACLNAAGGNIRNIALGAAFLAADAGEPVRMTHILNATRGEFAKLERPLSDVEIAGWV